MFVNDGSLYLIKAEVVVLAVIIKLVLMMFLTHLALLYYYSAGDWHSATQVSNSAGNVLSLLSSPKHRHGVTRGTTKTWLISTGFLVLAFAANYTGDLMQIVWSPAMRDFAQPVDVYLTNTYNVTIPYDLYSQFTANGSIVPDVLLDSRYNPVLNYTTLSPNTIKGEPISYFTIDYNGASILDSVNKPHPCSPDVSICQGEMESSVVTTCPVSYNLSSTYANSTKSIPIPCPTLYEFVPVTSYILPIQSRIAQYMFVSEDAWHKDNKPNPIGTNIRHSFRLSGIPYPDGRGLILQHNVVSYFPMSMDELVRNGTEATWPSTKCAETLAKFHFSNTTEACSNATVDSSNVTTSQRMFINTMEGPNETTMRYCIISVSGIEFVFSLNCGMQYLKVGHLGPNVPFYKDQQSAFYIQNQGSSDVWCSGSEDGYQRCILDDQSKSYRSVSSRGYGIFYASNTVPVEQQTISVPDLDIQIAKIDEMTNLTREIFLREYSIGSNDYILGGVPVRGVGHAVMLLYRISVSIFVVLVVLVALLLTSVMILHFAVLPSHYTASAFDVFRVATSPDTCHVNDPGKADQDISLHLNSDGNIIITNNGATIIPLNDEYPLDSIYSPSKVSLLAN